MAGNVGGVQEGGAAGTKRPAGNDLGNGNTKRANTRETAAKRTIVPVDDLLNVDFRGLTKLCHRHDRQVGDLGNPFQDVERWARRALPKAQWDSDKHVGHWMRSKSLGVVYMFKNGYCYDNGREFITVPVYGRWLEYIGFKHFKSDEGPEWYTILNATRPGFKTGNPERPNLDVGSWTMSRFGKPVIVGKDNNFYQSVLDAFRERNQAKITDDQEIEVPIKFLTMSNELELEPPRPHQLKMQEYGPYLRLLGESQKQTASQQPTESHEVTVGESKRGETTHNVTPETGKPKEETPIVESQQTNTSPNVQLPPNPKTPKKPRETATKISQGLTTPGSEKLTSEAVNKRKSPLGTQTPTGKTTEKAPVATGTVSQPNPGLRTPKEEQKTTSPTAATTTPAVVDTKVTAPTSSQPTGTGYIPESIGFSTYSNNRPRGSTGLVFGSKVPVPTGTQVQQPGTAGSLLNAKVAQNKGNTTGVTSSNAKTEAQAIAESRAIIEAQLAAELKTQRAATTAMELDDRGVFMTQSGTGSQAPIKGHAIAQAAIIDSAYQPFSVAAKQAFKHFVENEADKDTGNLDDEVNTGTQNPPKDPSKGKREELHGQSQRLSFGVEFEFVMPVVLEEWLDGSNIDEELLPALNVIPLTWIVHCPERTLTLRRTALPNSTCGETGWTSKSSPP
ncbi:hypothetical protein PG993_002581 [Apiospora rasikravindrae]|uniref:Uncharacterized protein n=1 Tax=Apiospora rasikravindrae TaxID=990691 RepID=A0ABR1TX20_9PEZI